MPVPPTSDAVTPRPISGAPAGDVPLPAPVRAIAAGGVVQPVWQNEAGGQTFYLPDAQRYVKWSPPGGIDLEVEANRLRWAYSAVGEPVFGAGLTTPLVLSHGSDAAGSHLVTAAIPARSAVDGYWLARPAVAAAAVGSGLRRWHDAAPVGRCPYSWSAAERVADAHRRRDRLDPHNWHPEHRGLTVDDALHRLAAPPPIDRLVVCHGDACSPNILIDEAGQACALVDLGRLGVADRWADLAIATWSVTWNYGPGWENTLLDAYGVAPDPERTAYYRLLWDLGP